MDTFSKRNNYSTQPKPITIRESAPAGLREFIVQTLYANGKNPSDLRKTFCRVLRSAPDDDNWTEFPNIDSEVRNMIAQCDWFKVYDIIEACYQQSGKKEDFTIEINDYFNESGIGWKLENGQIIYRGDEAFENDIEKAVEVLEQSNLNTARNEIHESIKDLSRKPNPDTTGAVQHGLASLECVAREITGSRTLTLGAVISKHRDIVPPPLDKAIESIWQFSSEQGRHLREGRVPGFEEAELLVGLSATIGTYLARKSSEFNKLEEEDNLPF